VTRDSPSPTAATELVATELVATARSIQHASFVVERSFDASPSRVFGAFADAEAKARWFKGPDGWESYGRDLDFRVGGREHTSNGPAGGPIHTFDAVYADIVPDTRIVYTYSMHRDETLTSVSVATLELRPEGNGTHLKLAEQGAFLDGLDSPTGREQGTRDLLDRLAASLRRP
jgi:uncharacterized protein YndB with AHSA1/START domain